MMRNPMAVAAWSLWMLLLIVVGVAVIGALVALAASGEIQAIIDGETLEEMDPQILIRMIAIGVPGGLLLFVGSWAISAIVMASATRMTLEPEASPRPYLRFGADEWRAFLLSLVFGLVYVGFILLIIGGGFALWQLGWWAGLLCGLAALVLWIWVSVRLSLAVPLSLAMRKFDLFGSWALTRGRFWPLFGSYILAWLFLTVASIAVGTVGQIAGGGAFVSVGMGTSTPSAIGLVIGVIMLTIFVALQMVYTVVQTVVLAATPAAIYREIGGSWQADVFQ